MLACVRPLGVNISSVKCGPEEATRPAYLLPARRHCSFSRRGMCNQGNVRARGLTGIPPSTPSPLEAGGW